MKVKILGLALVLGGLFVGVGIVYACSNIPPEAIHKFREHVIVGRSVIFDGSESYDPDGDAGLKGIIEFEWEFDFDGNNVDIDYSETSGVHSDGAFDGKTTYTYTSAKTYNVLFVVTDDGVGSGIDYDLVIDEIIVSADSDAPPDDLPDAWELYYWGNLLQDWDHDPDGDGFKNLCEYLHGTEPDNILDYPTSPSDNITIYVSNDASTIHRAIVSSIDGDIVEVSQGTYTENIDLIGREITLTSTDPDNADVVAATIIDGGGSGNVVTFNSSEDADTVLTGFTIKNGDIGINCSGTSPTITKCVISDNDNSGNGGGMYCTSSSSPVVTDCVFSTNSADNGGGIYSDGSDPELTNCEFNTNLADTDGGGMYCTNSSLPAITNCVFSGNLADNDGGGIYSDGSDPELSKCVFITNKADYDNSGGGDGGGMYCTNSSLPAITDCVFSGNLADNGGGIYNNGGDVTLINCVFSDENTADTDGGAIYNDDSEMTLINCTLVGNDATGDGGGMYNHDCPTLNDITATNCIFWDNTAGGDGGEIYNDNSQLTFSYCDIDGGINGNKCDGYPSTSGGGNIHCDPEFMVPGDPDGPDGDWMTGDDGLQLDSSGREMQNGEYMAMSQCIGRGYNDALAGTGITKDIKGDVRIVETVDMGAYESSDGVDPDYELLNDIENYPECETCDTDIWEVGETPKYVALENYNCTAWGELPKNNEDNLIIVPPLAQTSCGYGVRIGYAPGGSNTEYNIFLSLSSDSSLRIYAPDDAKFFCSEENNSCTTLFGQGFNCSDPPPYGDCGSIEVIWGPGINEVAYTEQCKASGPIPADEATGVAVDINPSWTAGNGASYHTVYLGTIRPGEHQGDTWELFFDPPENLDSNTEYYWRIDTGNPPTVTGDVWSFTTQ